MSYDVSVYVRELLDVEAVQQLIVSSGFRVDARSAGGAFSVVRGPGARYCFTVEAPARVEAEDVPVAVTAQMLAPSGLYAVLVGDSSEDSIGAAVRFARRLARAGRGVVLDEQTGQVWARGRLRAPPPATDPLHVDVVDLRWYVPRAGIAPDLAEVWLRTARRLLPEALPRRFGSAEPLQGRLERDGDEAFVTAYGQDEDSLLLLGSAPCYDGWLAAGDPRVGREIATHWLSVRADALEDAGWCGSVKRFFVAIAEASGAIYAAAEVEQGHILRRGRLWTDGDVRVTDSAPLVGQGWSGDDGWGGLGATAPWWSWFGPPYASVLQGALPGATRAGGGSGLLYSAAATPSAFAASAPSAWVPAPLCARQHDGLSDRFPAAQIPSELEPLRMPREDEELG